ncbi:hypothetical protein [Deinococcus sp. Marseille-Q6407]|uniref:hypothetical protein n=1 Tax=Deinococcus sp. Marseille-Q6407 TaxID=2969223 RepID=UPI0021C23E66|nr:hypothetical protein [Deinococcus sp. Marseille-Q6407]
MSADPAGPSGPLTRQLAQLTAGLSTADPVELVRAARQAYGSSFGLTAAVGAVLGLIGLWLRPLDLGAETVPLTLLGLAAALATLMFWLSGRQLRQALGRGGTARQRRTQLLAAAFGLAAAPAIPWLLACAALPRPGLAVALAALAAVTYGLGWQQLGHWARLL